MSTVDGLPHTWGQTFVFWGRPSCQGLWRDPYVNGHLWGGGTSQILVMVQITPISWEFYQCVGMPFV